MNDEFFQRLVIEKFRELRQELKEQHIRIDNMAQELVKIDQYLKDKEADEADDSADSESKWNKFSIVIGSAAGIIATIAIFI